MIHRTIICDYCGEKINHPDEDYLSVDAYWRKKDTVPEDMHLHESCWQTLMNHIDNQMLK